jgi:hypothetical protein
MFYFHGATVPSGPGPPHQGFTITLRHTTVCRTPQNERSTCKTNNTDNRQASMPPAGFELAIPSSKQPQTHALGRIATRIGVEKNTLPEYLFMPFLYSAISVFLKAGNVL